MENCKNVVIDFTCTREVIIKLDITFKFFTVDISDMTTTATKVYVTHLMKRNEYGWEGYNQDFARLGRKHELIRDHELEMMLVFEYGFRELLGRVSRLPIGSHLTLTRDYQTGANHLFFAHTPQQ